MDRYENIINMELNDLKIIIYVRKSEGTVERNCNVIEKLMEHGIHCMPCFFTTDAINLLPQQLWRHIDFKMTSRDAILSRYFAQQLGIP